MFERKCVFMCLMLASVYADNKDGSKSTTQKAPELETRFFGLENILGQIFHGPNPTGGFGGNFHHSPDYHSQHPQTQHNWQNIQTPNQAQSNFDQYLQATPYPQGIFNSQNNFGPDPNQNVPAPQQFPNQGQVFNQQSNVGYPTQGNFNPGNSFEQNQNFNPGTLDGIPSQNGQGNQPIGPWNQNPGNQFGLQNQNVGQTNLNAGFQNQNGNQMGSQNQNLGDDYNPVAILGKPVSVTTSAPDSIVFQDGCDTPAQRQCVQECQLSTDYNPVCGSNNITYFNPGRFICARNCGINVFIRRDGKCENQI